MPIVEPSRAGFTISGRPSSATTRIQSVARVDDAIARRRDAAREPDELRAPLVHRERRRHHAAAGVRDPQRLERALHGAVLAEAAVQRDEHAVEALALELDRSRSAGSNACASTPFSRSAFSTALPDRNEISRSDDGPPISTATLPNSLIVAAAVPGNARCVPAWLPDDAHFGLEVDAGLRTHRCANVRDQRLDVGGARAPPGLTMKFACFSDTRAPPIARPLRPQASISRAA